MPPTNFPPLTARFLYERFTEHISDQDRIVVYDPCSGWGGRILGAMATHRNRHIHYVGTDPNSDHWMPDFEMTKYEYLADYFNSNVPGPHHNSYELFRIGSEEIHKQPRFKKYKGKVDFVFTSPPYFAAEGYNDEETQSYKKFPEYGLWCDGYLRRTLQTAVEWLKPDRYLCLNIADVKLGSNLLPLERDTKKIIEELGMEYVDKLKMVLGATPGPHRKNKGRGTPTTRNFCRVNGNIRKYEPIFVFRKP